MVWSCSSHIPLAGIALGVWYSVLCPLEERSAVTLEIPRGLGKTQCEPVACKQLWRGGFSRWDKIALVAVVTGGNQCSAVAGTWS